MILVSTFLCQIAAAELYDNDELVLQFFETGEVNWSDMTIRASGVGVLNPDIENIAVARLGTERAAKIEAIRKLSETIKQVKVDSTTTIENFMTASDFVDSRVEAALKGAKIVEKKFFSDEEMEVTVEISMTGLLTEILIPHTGDIDTPSTGDEIYSGLIIDAGGLGLEPVISPKILDERYREIYGASYISKESALLRGIVVYEKEMSRAMENDRISNNPLIIQGIRTTGNSTNVVISSSDAQSLRHSAKNLSFLRHGKVIIVID